MSEGINSVLLQGELCWPELKYTQNGNALMKAKIKIPTTDHRSGEARSSYLRITAWQEFAEYLNSLPPRSNIRVSARIQERSFTNRDGQKQNVTDLVVDGVETVESAEGSNEFLLQGEVKWPEVKYVGQNNSTALFKGKLRIPFTKDDGSPGNAYVKITAWDDLAEGLGQIQEGDFVKVTGHIQDRTWEAPNGQKRVFTDAVVTNFTAAGAGANA